MFVCLTEDEANALQSILDPFSERAGRILTLEGLIEQWSAFVAEVELGYNRSIYDYLNDLAIRDILQKIHDHASQTVQQKLSDALKIWDSRFMKSTRMSAKPFDQEAINQDQPWWFRIPNDLQPELEADLRTEGFYD